MKRYGEAVGEILTRGLNVLERTVTEATVARVKNEQWARDWSVEMEGAKARGDLAEQVRLFERANLQSEEVGKKIRPAIEARAFLNGVTAMVEAFVDVEVL